MKKKKICWITADCFFDVDMLLVPYIRKQHPELDIQWIVVKTHDSKVTFSDNEFSIISLKHRARYPQNITTYVKAFKELGVRDANIIYSDSLGFPFYYPTLFAFKHRNQMVVHAAHNVIPYPVWPKELRWGVKYVFHFNEHFQLFSKFTYQWFKEHYPNKSAFYAPMVIKHFGEVRTDNYQVDASKINLLFFGNVVGNKRLDLLIDAVKHLPKNIQGKVHLNICGNCKMNKDAFVKQIGDCKAISTYFKRIPDEEIPELFTKHQYFMLPYEDVAQSGPHMIAYAYNLPVIASDIEGFAERVEDGRNGFLFRRDNEQSLIDAITKAVMQTTEERNEMRENLRVYVKDNFSLKAVAGRYMEYFNEITK